MHTKQKHDPDKLERNDERYAQGEIVKMDGTTHCIPECTLRGEFF